MLEGKGGLGLVRIAYTNQIRNIYEAANFVDFSLDVVHIDLLFEWDCSKIML